MGPKHIGSVAPETKGTASPPFDPASSLKTLRFWARCWGAIGGVLAGLVGIYASGNDLLSPRGGDLFFGFVLISGLLTPIMILLSPMGNVPPVYRRPFSARMAVSMNTFLVPVGGLLAYSLGALSSAGWLPFQSGGFPDLITTALTLLPVLLLGLIIASAVSRVPSAKWNFEFPLRRQRLVWISLITAASFAFGAFCITSISIASKIVVSEAPMPTEVEAVPVGTPGSSFRYSRPEGFENTPPHLWEVVARRRINGVETFVSPLPSNDGRKIAFIRSNNGGHLIVVIDLHRDEEIVSVPLSHKPTRIAWSPDDERIFNLAEKSDGCFLSVIDLPSETEIDMPTPHGHEVVDCGGLEWPSPNLIEIVDEDGIPQIKIDLTSLISSSIDEADARGQERLPEGVLAETGRWRLSLKHLGYSTGHSHSRGMPGLALVAEDLTIDYLRILYEVKFDSPNQISVTDDGSKILWFHRDSIDVYYLGIGGGSASEITVNLTEEIGGITALPPDIQDLLDQGKLWAMVSPPIINPLTGDPVAPDTSQSSAKLLAVSAVGNVVKFAVQESYAPVKPGKVVHRFLTSDNPDDFISTIPYRGKEPVGWWEPIVELSTKPVEELLPKGRAKAAEPAPSKPSTATVPSPPVEPDEPESPPSPEPERPPTVHPFPLAGADETPPTEPTNIPSDLPPAEQLIRYLHKAISEDDLAQVKESYAVTVDYLDEGFISNEELMDGHRRYREKWKSISEEVIGEIKLKPSSQTTMLAFYDLTSTVIDNTGRVVESKLSISLTISDAGGTPKIVKQKAHRL